MGEVVTITWSGTTATYSIGDQLVDTAAGSASNTWLYNTPIAAISQLGTTAQIRPIEDHRVGATVQNGKHVAAALGSGPCTTGCGVQGADANNLSFWVDLDCSTPSACVVTQTGKLADANNHIVYPSIGFASNGDIAISAASLAPHHQSQRRGLEPRGQLTRSAR